MSFEKVGAKIGRLPSYHGVAVLDTGTVSLTCHQLEVRVGVRVRVRVSVRRVRVRLRRVRRVSVRVEI